MKHNYITLNTQQDTRIEIGKRNAYHQAGQAAAIYLGNRQKQLPAVHFQIVIKPQALDGQQADRFAGIYSKYTVNVEGGRLVQSLPLSFTEATQDFSWYHQAEYRRAFEADIMNLLAGSLAEAKYVALRDGEAFSANLVNLGALHFYGGSSDLEVITEYMECFILDRVERDQKLTELFLAAFRFVNKPSNWLAICTLAEFIRTKRKGTINCEEVIALLDSNVTPHKVDPIALQTMEMRG